MRRLWPFRAWYVGPFASGTAVAMVFAPSGHGRHSVPFCGRQPVGVRAQLKRVCRFLLGSSVVACLGGDVAHAATYYVAKGGNDSNTCAQAQSTSTAKLTIAGGLKCLVAGDTLFVRAGNYDEGI